MVHIPWDEDTSGFKPGIYFARIRSCEEKQTKTDGTPMFALVIDADDFNRKLCHDNILCGGGGLGMGKAKLSCLGFGRQNPDIDPSELVGKRFYVAVKMDNYNGQDRLAVDVKQGKAGYWPEKDPPIQGVITPGPAPLPPIVEESPF